MRAFWKELRELAGGPDFLAIVVLCLVLGAGDRMVPRQASEAWRFWVRSRLERIWPAAPLQEALEELRWELRLPR